MNEQNLNNRAIRAGIIFVILQIAVKGISFIATPIYTRMLDTAQYGQIRVYESWLLLLAPIISLNLYRCGDQAKFEFGEKRYYSAISSIQFLCYLVIALFSVVLIVFKDYVKTALNMTDIMFYVMILYFFANCSLELMRRREKQMLHYKLNTITTVLTMFPATVLSIILIWYGKQVGLNNHLVELRILGFYAPQIIGGILLFFLLLFQGKRLINFQVWKYAVLFCLPLIPEMISIQIMNQSDKIMIQSLVGADETGIYSLGTTVSWIVWVLEDAVWNAWQPWVYEKISRNENEDIKKPWTLLMHGLGLLSLVLVLLGPEIIFVLGDSSYKDAVYLIAPLNASMLFHFYNNSYSAVISYNKRTDRVAINTIIAMLVNVILNYFCILKWGYMAAAYTTAFSYFLLMVIQAITERRLTGNNIMPLRQTIKLSILYFLCFEGSIFLYDKIFIVRYGLVAIIAIVVLKKIAIPYYQSSRKKL